MASTYVVQRKEIINASQQDVFNWIVNLKRWPEWSPWEELDPNMEKTYIGTNDGQVGSGYSWKGNRKAGEGSLTLTAIDAPRSIKGDLTFLKPFKSESTLDFDIQGNGTSTDVTWTMTATHNLMTRVMGLFGMMDRMVGKDFEKGLSRIKQLSET